MSRIQRYIPLADAATKYEVSEGFLSQAVERGIIRAIRVNGHIAVAEDDVRKLRNGEPSAEIPQYIPLAEAAERYGISEACIGFVGTPVSPVSIVGRCCAGDGSLVLI